MKRLFIFVFLEVIGLFYSTLFAQLTPDDTLSTNKHLSSSHYSAKNLYIEVHHLGQRKMNYDVIAKAHAQDLAIEKKHGVKFLKYWMDEAGGNVYCLFSSTDSQSIQKTHVEAHWPLPDEIYQVTDGMTSQINSGKGFFLDIHQLGTGKVTAKDVAVAHQKDLAVEKKYDVNFINYWVDEKQGVVMCLSQATDSNAVINTHREAHGLLPAYIMKVKPND